MSGASASTSQELDDDTQRQITEARVHADPRQYMLHNWTHPNDPTRYYDFQTDDGEPLYYLTDDDSPLNPKKWGDINVLLFARGCLKTTSCIGVANWFLDEYPNGEIANTAPRKSQKGEVVDRFKERVEDSKLVDRRVKDNIDHQKFKDTVTYDDEEKTVYSSLKSRSAWGGGDGLRGLHSHIGIIDEFQDADETMFSTFLEAIDQELPTNPYVPSIFCIGTPKLENSFFADLWEMSDRKTWDADKQEWIQQDEPESYGHAEDTYEVRGWHIDQHNSPLHNEGRIEFKKQTYSTRKFQNEVLAQFYTPEDDLITQEVVRENFDKNLGFRNRRFSPDSEVTVGVDWGGGQREGASKTVISVIESMPDDKNILVNIHFLDNSLEPHDEIERVEECIMKHDADKCVVDYGHGNKQLKDLQDGNGTYKTEGYTETVKGCQYGNVKNKYDPKWETDTGLKRYFTVDRGYMMESFVDFFKHDNFVIPSKDISFDGRHSVGTRLVDHLTAPHKEKKETRSGKKKLNITTADGRNDDAFQSMTYAFIAQKVLGNSRQVHSVVSRDRRGY